LCAKRSIIVDLTEDIRSVTDLKRHTREILDHVHATGRPVVLTVNGRADSVILDAAVYQKHLQASNLARLLAPAEAEAAEGRTRSASDFISEFKRGRNVPR
jgi:prevent-host-death family protein